MSDKIEKLNFGFLEHFLHPLSIHMEGKRENLSAEDQAEAKRWAFIGLI